MRSRRRADDAAQTLAEALEREGARGHQAIAAATLHDGRVEFAGWAAAGPPPDGDALFEIGSITKVFTGILLADMHLRGELQLADPLSAHLAQAAPQWPGPEPTLLDLATHRSGLPNTPRSMGRRELAFALGVRRRDPWADVDELRYRRLVNDTERKPRRGAAIRYSSMGFGLLGDALAAAAGMPYEALLRERVLAPLGMHATAISPTAPVLQGHSAKGKPKPPMDDMLAAAGSLRSNLTDMTIFLRACLSPGPESPGPALALAQRPAHRIGRRMSIGFGWLITRPRGEAPIVWHNGGTWGFRSIAGFQPQRDRAAVVLSNCARPVDRLGWAVLEPLGGEG